MKEHLEQWQVGSFGAIFSHIAPGQDNWQESDGTKVGFRCSVKSLVASLNTPSAPPVSMMRDTHPQRAAHSMVKEHSP